MKYSVWNNSNGTYSVFESVEKPFPSLKKQGSSLGAVPGESLDLLPPESKYLGESEFAEGKIVRQPSRFMDFAIILAASLLARWIYERFFKEQT
jgi:hypothetical protein